MDLLFFVGRKIEYMMHSKFLLDRLFSLVQTYPKAERERETEKRCGRGKAKRAGREVKRAGKPKIPAPRVSETVDLPPTVVQHRAAAPSPSPKNGGFLSPYHSLTPAALESRDRGRSSFFLLPRHGNASRHRRTTPCGVRAAAVLPPCPGGGGGVVRRCRWRGEAGAAPAVVPHRVDPAAIVAASARAGLHL
jgi:hypothetical protein